MNAPLKPDKDLDPAPPPEAPGELDSSWAISYADARDIEEEVKWLCFCIDHRIQCTFELDQEAIAQGFPTAPELSSAQSPFAVLLHQKNATLADRLILILAATPHIAPEALDIFFTHNKNFDRIYTEFGGIHNGHGAFQPTYQTALFILSGQDVTARYQFHTLLHPEHWLFKDDILDTSVNNPETVYSERPLRLSGSSQNQLLHGGQSRPGPEFPAAPISTRLDWDDLILSDSVDDDLRSIEDWLNYGDQLMQDPVLGKTTRPGFRALFHGPPGTGKTLTAALLGKSSGRPVYRVDLSLIVSKFIGETEKNLARIFATAEHKNWILFFDEADALFANRSAVSSSNDRHANQEVAFLLQRIEDYNGLVILASNLKDNIDEAFCRRFQAMVYFPKPEFRERLKLWQRSFSPNIPPANDVDLQRIAREYELSGGSITNIVRGLSLTALREKDVKNKEEISISAVLLKQGIRKELLKEGVCVI